MFALNAATGDQLWNFPAASAVDGGVAVDDGVAYIGTAFDGIYAIGGTDQGPVAATTSPPASSSDTAATTAR